MLLKHKYIDITKLQQTTYNIIEKEREQIKHPSLSQRYKV